VRLPIRSLRVSSVMNTAEAVQTREPVDPYNVKGKSIPYYISTPIYYVNGRPHLGHAYTTVCGDMIARFHRNDGRQVFFLTGTDEHGQKVEQSAKAAGMEPQQFADSMSKIFVDLIRSLGCEPDRFIRTTEADHRRTVQALWKILEDRGYIYLGAYEGWYSVRDEAFYAESELTDGKAPTGAAVEWVKEESYFFKLSEFTQPLLDHLDANPNFILPRGKQNEVIGFLKQIGGLRDLSVSRTTFSWGIPVPGNEKHVVYVWLDALANYITAIGFPDHDPIKFARFWPANLHLVGKDILRFHCIYWPAFLMAAGLPLPKVRAALDLRLRTISLLIVFVNIDYFCPWLVD
jgi:methionyl-tRNA synthetase